MSVDADPLYKVTEAGAYLGGLSRATVYRLINAGELSTVAVGKRGATRLRRSDLNRYIDAHRTERKTA